MKQAFSSQDIQRIKTFLGPSNVLVLDTPDLFLCNSIVLKDRILVNKPMIPDLATYRQIEAFTGKKIHVLDTSEFNKSGGGIRCMVLAIDPL
jgi:N-dimethylarginine dimethylaminohydrolase